MYRVLTIDDEPWILELTRGLVPWKDLRLTLVAQATNGVEGLRLSREKRPDIVITDIRMPGIDGLELIEKLKDSSPAPSIVILSGYDEFAFAQRALRLGVVDYLLKPVDERELIAILESVVLRLDDARAQEKEVNGIRRRGRKYRALICARDGATVLRDVSDARVQKVIDYINSHYHEDVTLEGLADVVFLAPTYLSERFRKEVGQTFRDYVTCLRMNTAKRLLKRPELRIREVATLVGYRDPDYFSRAFKKHTKQSPGQWRIAHSLSQIDEPR